MENPPESVGEKNVAADLHTDNGNDSPQASSDFETAMGDIRSSRFPETLTRAEIKEYQTALAFAQRRGRNEIVQYWGEDVDFCFNSRRYQSELEFIAWKLASNAGVLHFTPTTNATFANEFDLELRRGRGYEAQDHGRLGQQGERRYYRRPRRRCQVRKGTQPEPEIRFITSTNCIESAPPNRLSSSVRRSHRTLSESLRRPTSPP